MKASVVVGFGLAAVLGACGAPPRQPAPDAQAIATAVPPALMAQPPVAFARSPAEVPAAPHRIDFAAEVRPIMEANCKPCHFEGGKVYAELPFDKPETIISLGEALFSRIKDEDQQRVIRQFLSEHPR